MTTLTFDDLRAQVDYFYTEVFPATVDPYSGRDVRAAYHQMRLDRVERDFLQGELLEETKSYLAEALIEDAKLFAVHNNAFATWLKQPLPFPIEPFPSVTLGSYVNVMDEALPTEIVDYLFPGVTGPARDAVIAAIESGDASKSAVVAGYMTTKFENQDAPAAELLDTFLAEADVVAPPLPESSFAYPGVSEERVDFITAVYVGLFGRAPENEGLAWWSFELKNFLDAGMTGHQALQEVAKHMYNSATVTGEGGTTMNNADFVTWAYQNALGREPDAGGHAYWTGRLDRGEETRDTFAVSFLGDALGAAGDSDYLQARVAVAKWVAQEHVTGHGNPVPWPDLVRIIENVATAGDAYRVLTELQEIYGDAPAAAPAQKMLTWDNTTIASQGAELDVQLAVFATDQPAAASYGTGEQTEPLQADSATLIGAAQHEGWLA